MKRTRFLAQFRVGRGARQCETSVFGDLVQDTLERTLSHSRLDSGRKSVPVVLGEGSRGDERIGRTPAFPLLTSSLIPCTGNRYDRT